MDKIERLDRSIFIVVSLLLLAVLALLTVNLALQYSNYNAIIQTLIEQKSIDSNLLAYSRAMDFAFAKTTALCLGFILVFVGALYVLRMNESAYSIKGEGGGASISFQTASPGLVMATLGVIAILATIYNKSFLSVSNQAPQADLTAKVVNLEEIQEIIKFKYGSVELTQESESQLNKVCVFLRENGLSQPNITGYGDGDKAPEYELVLGERRAAYLQNKLSSVCSFEFKPSVVSYGELPLPIETERHIGISIQPQ